MSARLITPEEARALIKDPLAVDIAEYTWVEIYGNDPLADREHSADRRDGQWDYCVNDSVKLAAYVRQLRDVETSSLYTDSSS